MNNNSQILFQLVFEFVLEYKFKHFGVLSDHTMEYK